MFYWILEYGKVLAAYLIVMYLWPSVVLHKYFINKGLAYRFAFCATFMILLLNTTVLMLGIVKLLNQWIIRILFWGPLVYAAGLWLCRHSDKAIYIKYLLTDICSLRRFTAGFLNKIGSAIKNAWHRLINRLRPHLLLYIMLAVAVIYGMIYFSYGAFHERYYGAPDIYVHHSWIDMLLEGKIFGAGVYPEGMHCVVYALNSLLGVEVYSCLLFLGGIHIFAFLLSVYLFFREIFPWKYSGVFAIVLYLIVGLNSEAHITGMTRMQWTTPQEFAIFAVFLCGAYLLRFLRNVSNTKIRWKKWEFLRDENLLVFVMALAVTIAVHFYATIMAFFLCLAIGVFFIIWVFRKKQVKALLLAIVCGVLIASTPMLLARASGIQFQGSIGWALGVIEKSREEAKKPEVETTHVIEQESGKTEVHNVTSDTEKVTQGENENPEQSHAEQKEPEKTFIEKFFENSFSVLYGEESGMIIVSLICWGILLGMIGYLVVAIQGKVTVGENPFFGYVFLIACDLIFMLLYAAPGLGMLELIDHERIGTMTHMLSIGIWLIPLDLIMTCVGKRGNHILVDLCTVGMCVGMCAIVILTGQYHSYLFNYATRYPAVAQVTNQIVQEMEPETYTVVSTVDELYHVKGKGFHEEAVLFVHNMYEESYTLPTEYVFIFLEKQPLIYAHAHFPDGPSWLANKEYISIVGESGASQAPEMRHTVISDIWADFDADLPMSSKSYSSSMNRSILQSRLYRWVERFKELYPYQLTTVYEDDAFVCYMFQQNPARLLELAIMD